jgi:hypothetical protein
MLHLMEKDTLSRVEREKGKFRSFLLVSLQYFLANERDKQQAQKRGGDSKFIELDHQNTEDRYLAELTDHADPSKVFERRWAMTLLERVLNRLELEFTEPGRRERFRELQVFLLGEPRSVSYVEVGKRLGIREGAVKVAVLRLQRGRQRHRLQHALAPRHLQFATASAQRRGGIHRCRHRRREAPDQQRPAPGRAQRSRETGAAREVRRVHRLRHRALREARRDTKRRTDRRRV